MQIGRCGKNPEASVPCGFTSVDGSPANLSPSSTPARQIAIQSSSSYSIFGFCAKYRPWTRRDTSRQCLHHQVPLSSLPLLRSSLTPGP